jgi:thiol-disulfide isomerase/thioredoxin
MVKYTLPFFLLFSFFGCNGNQDNTAKEATHKAQHLHVNDTFSFTTLDGKTITLKKKNNGFILKEDPNKLLFIDLFASWCRPCQNEAPILSSLQKKYENQLVIISIPVEKISKENLETFANTYKATYTIANSTNNQSFTQSLSTQLNLDGNLPIPLMVLYKDGVEVNHYIGATEEEFLESDIKQALGK